MLFRRLILVCLPLLVLGCGEDDSFAIGYTPADPNGDGTIDSFVIDASNSDAWTIVTLEP